MQYECGFVLAVKQLHCLPCQITPAILKAKRIADIEHRSGQAATQQPFLLHDQCAHRHIGELSLFY